MFTTKELQLCILLMVLATIAASLPLSNCSPPTCKIGLETKLCSTDYDSRCPLPGTGTWKCLELELTCTGEERFHCLEVDNSNISVLICAIPHKCIAGLYPILDATTKRIYCRYCPQEYFKSFPGLSHERSVCYKRKGTCSKHEVECHAGNNTHDRECRCDVRQGYHDKTNSTVSGQCCGKKYDQCECFPIRCGENEELLLNGTCGKKCEGTNYRTKYSDECQVNGTNTEPSHTDTETDKNLTDSNHPKKEIIHTTLKSNETATTKICTSCVEESSYKTIVVILSFVIIALIVAFIFCERDWISSQFRKCTDRCRRRGNHTEGPWQMEENRRQQSRAIEEDPNHVHIPRGQVSDDPCAPVANGSGGRASNRRTNAQSGSNDERLDQNQNGSACKKQVEKGKMRPTDMNTITRNLVALKEEIDLGDDAFMDYMAQECLFSLQDVEDVKLKFKHGGKQDAMSLFTEKLRYRGEDALSKFLNVLRHAKYYKLVKVLENARHQGGQESRNNTSADLATNADHQTDDDDRDQDPSEKLIRGINADDGKNDNDHDPDPTQEMLRATNTDDEKDDDDRDSDPSTKLLRTTNAGDVKDDDDCDPDPSEKLLGRTNADIVKDDDDRDPDPSEKMLRGTNADDGKNDNDHDPDPTQEILRATNTVDEKDDDDRDSDPSTKLLRTTNADDEKDDDDCDPDPSEKLLSQQTNTSVV